MQAEALGGGEVVYAPPAHLEEKEGEDQDEKSEAKGFVGVVGH